MSFHQQRFCLFVCFTTNIVLQVAEISVCRFRAELTNVLSHAPSIHYPPGAGGGWGHTTTYNPSHSHSHLQSVNSDPSTWACFWARRKTWDLNPWTSDFSTYSYTVWILIFPFLSFKTGSVWFWFWFWGQTVPDTRLHLGNCTHLNCREMICSSIVHSLVDQFYLYNIFSAVCVLHSLACRWSRSFSENIKDMVKKENQQKHQW